jgi:hypothetical protein
MSNRRSESRPPRTPVGGVPRALRPYKPRNSGFIIVFVTGFVVAATAVSLLAGQAQWTLILPWITVAAATFCYFRERPCTTVIPGSLWGLGLSLSSLGTVALLLLFH